MRRLSLDPRSKLIASAVAVCFLILFNRWIELSVALGFLMGTALLLGLGREWTNLLRGLSFAAFTFFVIAWFAFDFLTATVAALRLLTIGAVSFLFFQTTSPEDLSNALIKMGVPYPLAFVLTASMQFVHVLLRRVANILDAQRARGIRIEGGFGTLLHLSALAGPLLVQSFQLADQVAEAMEARGFGAPGRRFRHEPCLTRLDWAVVISSLLTFFFLIWIYYV